MATYFFSNMNILLPKIASLNHYSILAKSVLGGETKLISKSKIRDMRDSAWCAFERWITQKDWSSVLEANMCKDKFNLFTSELTARLSIDSFHKEVKKHPTDRPWITTKIKKGFKNANQLLSSKGKC